MTIIGCDFHPSWLQVSWFDTETGETGEQKDETGFVGLPPRPCDSPSQIGGAIEQQI